MRWHLAVEARAFRRLLRRGARALGGARASLPVVTALFFLLLCACLLHLPELQHDSLRSAHANRGVTLLIWTHPFGRYRTLPDCWARYQIKGCRLTDDPLEYPHVDAVVVHHREVATGAVELPWEPRPRAQKWIWMNYESPTHTPALWRFEGKFNLTLTYRADSDIFLPYGYLEPGVAQSPGAHLLHAPPRARLKRPRLVAWVISNWSESQARVAFFYELQRYVRVDVYGRLGLPLAVGSGSVVRLLSRYQFYLALENSQHTDYITEKLWNAVVAGAVPVVLGASRRNYERFLPPKAFIHVNDFPSVRGLARYLLMLHRNPSRLWHHLDWREGYSAVQPAFWAHHYCTACRAVRESFGTTQVVHSLEQWFWSNQNSFQTS
ncbi:alpha-(1,3)-fucosyltransferase 4-like [Eucyclogobius newberryi]|uniref:alpha-(1,3)-fucosyltransferase 4-like n=1 Tax=Eucyclogobius newberryi TaxID=166745 RepID=UPI003B59D8E4